jgi:hypothetical protein
MSSPASPRPDEKLTLRRLPRLAIEGAIGNATWALLLIVGVVGAALLKGEIAAWIALLLLVITLGVCAFVATALMRQVERMRGSREEARRQAADAVQREEKADTEKRELREQLAAATGGEQAISTRMQSIARQVDALASTGTAWANGPDSSQVALLVGLLEEFRGLLREDDPIVDRLLSTWGSPFAKHNDGAWNTALQVLKARALSIGAEEALGQQR